jgi:hypothetical protein
VRKFSANLSNGCLCQCCHSNNYFAVTAPPALLLELCKVDKFLTYDAEIPNYFVNILSICIVST